MPEKRNKYDTDPLDPDFVRRTEELMGRTQEAPDADGAEPLRPRPAAEEPTRRFDEQVSDSYPSVFVPPAYQPPRQPQPFTTFGGGPHQPPATTNAPPPGPSSPYAPNPAAGPSSRPVEKLGLAENIANALPYAPFYIGLVAALIELFIVPRHETRTRFHAAQGLALQLAVIAGSLLFQIVGSVTNSRFGGFLFWLATFVFLIVSTVRVYKGSPHHVAALDDATAFLNERIAPVNQSRR